MLAGTLPSPDGRVRSESEGLATTRPGTPGITHVSFDVYRTTVGGSITIAVTGTDNPVPTQSDRTTPSAPVVPEDPTRASDATASDESKTTTKEAQQDQS